MKEAPIVHAEIFRYKMLRRDRQLQAEISVTFKCPNCSKNHSVTEITSTPFNFHTVFYNNLACGPVNVEMPWEWARKNAHRLGYKNYPPPTKILIADATKPCYAPHSYGPPARILVAQLEPEGHLAD